MVHVLLVPSSLRGASVDAVVVVAEGCGCGCRDDLSVPASFVAGARALPVPVASGEVGAALTAVAGRGAAVAAMLDDKSLVRVGDEDPAPAAAAAGAG